MRMLKAHVELPLGLEDDQIIEEYHKMVKGVVLYNEKARKLNELYEQYCELADEIFGPYWSGLHRNEIEQWALQSLRNGTGAKIEIENVGKWEPL